MPEDPVRVSPLGSARHSQVASGLGHAKPQKTRTKAVSGSFTSLAGLTVASSGGCPPPFRDRPVS